MQPWRAAYGFRRSVTAGVRRCGSFALAGAVISHASRSAQAANRQETHRAGTGTVEPTPSPWPPPYISSTVAGTAGCAADTGRTADGVPTRPPPYAQDGSTPDVPRSRCSRRRNHLSVGILPGEGFLTWQALQRSPTTWQRTPATGTDATRISREPAAMPPAKSAMSCRASLAIGVRGMASTAVFCVLKTCPIISGESRISLAQG